MRGFFIGIAQMDKKYKQANTMLNIRITMQVLWYIATMASRVRRSAAGESSGRAPARRSTLLRGERLFHRRRQHDPDGAGQRTAHEHQHGQDRELGRRGRRVLPD